MENKIDFTKVVPRPLATGSLTELEREALEFLRGFSWCTSVLELYKGISEPGIVGVFLCRIHPARPEVDNWLWVVVGDLPPAYLVTDEAPNPASALDGYVSLMRHWVTAAEQGLPVDDLIPVNVPPTREYAAMLATRLNLLEEHLRAEYADDLADG